MINPATEEAIATISLGSAADVDDAVAAARRAFRAYSQTTREERLALLQRIIEVYQTHYEEMAETISREMGAPMWLVARRAGRRPASAHLVQHRSRCCSTYEFEESAARRCMRREPIGVCGLITPWNWPVNQIACKVASRRSRPAAPWC